MRNFKKVMAIAIAAVLMLGLTVTAFAAPSVKAKEGADVKSAGDTADGGYIVEDLGDHFAGEAASVAQEDLDAITAANNGGASAAGVKAFTDALAKSGTAGKDDVSGALKDKKFLATFFDVYPWGNAATENADVALEVAGIGDYKSDEIVFVHYNVSAKKWEVLKNVKIEGNTITVHYDSFSPTAIAVSAQGGSSSDGQSSDGSTSPKTGVESNWLLFAVAAMLFAASGAFVSRKKRA